MNSEGDEARIQIHALEQNEEINNQLEQKEETRIFFKFFIVIQLQLCAFSPHPSTPPHPHSCPSPTSTLPLHFGPVSFIVVPVIPSSDCPHPTPPWLLLDCA